MIMIFEINTLHDKSQKSKRILVVQTSQTDSNTEKVETKNQLNQKTKRNFKRKFECVSDETNDVSVFVDSTKWKKLEKRWIVKNEKSRMSVWAIQNKIQKKKNKLSKVDESRNDKSENWWRSNDKYYRYMMYLCFTSNKDRDELIFFFFTSFMSINRLSVWE